MHDLGLQMARSNQKITKSWTARPDLSQLESIPHQEIDKSYVVQERRTSDFEAEKGSVGLLACDKLSDSTSINYIRQLA